MEIQSCPLCNDATNSFKAIEKNGYYALNCRNCGNYEVTEEIIEDNILNRCSEGRHILSGIVKNNIGPKPVLFHSDNIVKLLNSSEIPRTPLEKAEHLILYLYSKTGFPGMGIQLRLSHDFAITYSKNVTEFVYVLNYLRNEKYIDRYNENDETCRLTFDGFKKVDELLGKRPKGDQCFIAMSFAPELDDAFDIGLKEAVLLANYKDMRVDRVPHNDKIDDKIISEIRRSSLVVADVTMHRQGVYFEAGFAMGLGIPVIWTCKDTDIDEAHFDTRQYNHIIWKDAEDLKGQLFNRIQALYPRQ